jgi:Sec7-like guanine-nucleotide exchange factor
LITKEIIYSFLHLKYKSSKYKHSRNLFQKHFQVDNLNLNESGLIPFLKPKNGRHSSSAFSVFVLQPTMQLKKTLTAETPRRVFVLAQIQRGIAAESFERKSQT